MGKSCFIDVSPKDIEEVTGSILKSFDDSILALIPVFPQSTHAPTAKKKYFRIKFEAVIPTEAIQGGSALTDFGGMMILRLPKNRIQPQFLKEKNKEDD